MEIAHAEMRVGQDFIAGLEIVHDGTGNKADPTEVVDSAGYQYKSYWVANCNLADTSLHRRYNRYYPKDSLSYLLWNSERDSCNVTFRRDSLYAVGGSLSVACEGYLSPIENIDNKFTINTDSTINDSTSIPKIPILIDSDPVNSLFINRLSTDRTRAIAWEEYAGSNDRTHCNEETMSGRIYNPRFNHYWDRFVNSHGDTCFDTRTPCENARGNDTGIMQIYRTTWETTFDGTDHIGEYPGGFVMCKWDSLAWNWQICIHNGYWILTRAMPHKMKPVQQAWPESCSFADCDSVPDEPNKEDLANYGYHAGEPRMRFIDTEELWKKYINNPEDPEYIERANYIKRVRRYKYRGDLW